MHSKFQSHSYWQSLVITVWNSPYANVHFLPVSTTHAWADFTIIITTCFVNAICWFSLQDSQGRPPEDDPSCGGSRLSAVDGFEGPPINKEPLSVDVDGLFFLLLSTSAPSVVSTIPVFTPNSVSDSS